jgi:hypothetical protein
MLICKWANYRNHAQYLNSFKKLFNLFDLIPASVFYDPARSGIASALLPIISGLFANHPATGLHRVMLKC